MDPKDELAELLFSLLEELHTDTEDINSIKEEVDKLKDILHVNPGDIDSISSMQYNIKLLQEEQLRISSQLANFSENDFNLIKGEVIDDERIKLLESKLQMLEGRSLNAASGLQSDNDAIDIVLRERKSWHTKMTIIILTLIIVLGFILIKMDLSSIRLGIVALIVSPFIVAMFVVDRNLKRLNLDSILNIASDNTKGESSKKNNNNRYNKSNEQFFTKEDLVEVSLP